MANSFNTGHDTYVPYKEKQKNLAGIISRSITEVDKLKMEQYVENLRRLNHKVQNDTFKIQIVGTFKNGKSTFINSFLGEEILPAYNLPCTAVINEVKYGEEKKAVLHFCNPLPKDVRMTDIPERAFAHMKQYNMTDIPPMVIPYDEIENYVVIPIGKDPHEALKESPFEKVELFWPLDLLKNGVEIIDSPGLNEAESRTKVTMDYLTKADAIIFLLRADQLCSQDEMNFVEYYLKGNGFDKPFFVINRFDTIRNDREKAQIKAYAYAKLKEYTSFGESGFFFVSALNALDGKMNMDAALYEGSGLPAFEKRLSEFLTKEKGLVKLSQPSREVKRVLSSEALYKIIPQQRAMLESSLDEVKKKYEDVKPQLKDLQVKKDLLRERLTNKINMAIPDVKRCVLHHISNMSQSIPTWCAECVPQTKLGMMPGKDKIKRVAEEIAVYANEQMEKSQVEWKNDTLLPLIEEKIKTTFDSVEADVKKVFDTIDSIQVQLSNGGTQNATAAPTWQRVVGAVGGMVLGGPALAVIGGTGGIGKDFAKSLALEAGALFALSLINFLNPFTIGLTIIGMFVIGGSGTGDKITNKIKENVSKEMITQLNNNKDEIVDGILENVTKSFNDISEMVVKAVDTEISEVDKQIKNVIAELEKGQSNVESRKEELNVSERTIVKLVEETDDFIDNLVNTAY